MVSIFSFKFPVNSNSSSGDLFSSDSDEEQSVPTEAATNSLDTEFSCPECGEVLDWYTRCLEDKSEDGCMRVESDDRLNETVTFGVDVEEAVREMRFLIRRKTLLTASAGNTTKYTWLLAFGCEEYVLNKKNPKHVF